uniref:histidine kinase n=1 Tax=Magnetococcus massalia (strain MO-1) TaxID=451514 RepID=A0A1S7LI49_MAGMO|nr:putative Histidine kinase with HAMP domain, two PAS 3 domain, HisKA domain, HATPase_c domain and response reg domain [Candidatus Magnetococcus massalia]
MLRVSLTTFLALATMLLAGVMVVAVGTISYQAIEESYVKEQKQAQQQLSQAITGRVQELINYLHQDLQTLSENPLLANALIDPRGRDVYLPRYFSGIEHVGQLPAELFFTNFIGQVLSRNQPESKPLLPASFISRAVESGNPLIMVKPHDQGVYLLVGYPVKLFSNQMPEGMLLAQMPVTGLLEAPQVQGIWNGSKVVEMVSLDIKDLVTGRQWHLSSGEKEDSMATAIGPSEIIHLGDETLQGELQIYGYSHQLQQIMQRLKQGHLQQGALLLVITAFLATLMAYLFGRRIDRMVGSIHTLVQGDQLTGRIATSGLRELDMLGGAFNEVLDRLTASHQAQKERELAERQARQKLARAQSIAKLGNWEWDIRSGQVSWSHEIYQIFGLDGEVTPTCDLFIEHVHPDDRGRVKQAIEVALYDESREYYCRHRVVQHNGSERWVEEYGEVQLGDNGKPISMSGTVHDVTARLLAEKAVAESEERFRQLAENIDQVFWLMDLASQRVLYVSPSCAVVWGRDVSEIYNDPEGWLEPVHPRERASLRALFLSSDKDEKFSADFTLDYDQVGHERIVSYRGYPIMNERGEVVRMAGIAEDITARRAYESYLKLARREAEKAEQAKSKFLAMMSHEIRTPMNAILGMAELLSESPLNEEQKSYLAIQMRASDTLLALIDDILSLSRIDYTAETSQLPEEAFSISEIMQHALSLIELQAQQKGVALRWSIDPNLPDRVIGSVSSLRQVLLNLVGNAIKFTDEGEISLKVSLLPAEPHLEQDETLQWQVEDSGKGISPSNLERIFSPFTQEEAYDTRAYGGTGLGLTIVQRLVERMQGRVWCESVLGRGSRFNIVTPYKPAPDQQEPAEQPAVPTQPVVGASILLAEDSNDNALLIEKILIKQGYVLTRARDGVEAVSFARLGIFDLVFMDLQMPRMDGLSAVSEIRLWEGSHGVKEPLPVVALTAHAMESDRQKSLQAGCDDFLTKPVRRDKLLAMVEKYLLRV